MDADIAATQHGIAKISDITAKYGKSPREVFVSNAQTANEAIQVGSEFGVPVETFAPGLFPMLTEQRASFIAGPVPPPPPGSFEAIGDKGVKQLVDILTAVGDGKLDADSAKETLKRVFHIPEKIAEGMIPEPDLGIIKALHPKPAAPAGGNGSKAQNKRVTKPKAAARK
jgi:hypothetical protein